jgi:hypothetical protein
VASPRGFQPRAVLEAEAERQLAGVGDPALGEWREQDRVVFHLRRRLSAREQASARLDVADVRGTVEAVNRALAVGPRLVYAPPDAIAEELRDLAPLIRMN